MAKKRNDYFELMIDQVSYCVEASNVLRKVLENFNCKDVQANREYIHEIEHRADSIQREIMSKLSTEFITPIDQEDILRLVQIVDDITDALDEVMQEIYIYHVTILPDEVVHMAESVGDCVDALSKAIGELRNFKKPEMLRQHLSQVNKIESAADEIYIAATHKLFGCAVDVKTLIANKAIYDSLENCCDLCEHAADVIEQTIVKNT